MLHRLDHDTIVERLGKGEFLFTFDARDKSVSVEKDINSLVTFTALPLPFLDLIKAFSSRVKSLFTASRTRTILFFANFLFFSAESFVSWML